MYVYLFEEPKVYLTDCISVNADKPEEKIPKICYQTWEEKFFHKSFAKSLIQMRNDNSDFSFVLYDASQRDDYMKSMWSSRKIYEVYSRARFKPMKADLFRYCILYDLGGVYCDISVSPGKFFNEFLVEGCDFFVTLDKFSDHIFLPKQFNLFQGMNLSAHYLWNGFIGARPNSIFLGSVIDEIESWFNSYDNPVCLHPRADIISYTGPGRLTEVFLSRPWKNFMVWNSDAPRVKLNHKGSSLRHLTSPSYMDFTNQKLFLD